MAAVTPRDARIIAASLSCLLLLFGFQTVGEMTNMALWGLAGVSMWSWAFTVSGRLKTRGHVEDNVRVVRHQSFVVSALCFGTALVGTIEAMIACYVQPWWLQVPANIGFTLLAFAVGCSVFGFSHDWVSQDPRLEKPLFLLDICVVS
ncbi:unnamed protein product [Pylaiella littoralis]